MTLTELRKIAAPLGVKIEADRDDTGWCYWLLKADESGEGVFEDDNFCADRDEVYYKLMNIRAAAA